MSTVQQGFRRTYKAGADLSTKKYFAVKFSTTSDKTVLLATTPTDFIGFIESPGVAPRAGASPGITVQTVQENVSVVIDGMTKAVSGAAITRGDQLTIDGNGKVQLATTGQIVVARAEESISAADRYISVLIVAKHAASA